jgi:hypothetical protein
MEPMTTAEAMNRLYRNLPLAAHFALYVLNLVAPLMLKNEGILGLCNVSLYDKDKLLGKVDVYVEISDVDTARTVLGDLRASRVIYAAVDADDTGLCVVGSVDRSDMAGGVRRADCLRILVRTDGKLYLEIENAAQIAFR